MNSQLCIYIPRAPSSLPSFLLRMSGSRAAAAAVVLTALLCTARAARQLKQGPGQPWYNQVGVSATLAPLCETPASQTVQNGACKSHHSEPDMVHEVGRLSEKRLLVAESLLAWLPGSAPCAPQNDQSGGGSSGSSNNNNGGSGQWSPSPSDVWYGNNSPYGPYPNTNSGVRSVTSCLFRADGRPHWLQGLLLS